MEKKTNDKVLSIIVASYNVEKYLRKCLDSFLISNRPERLEVLVIDDGSGDGTLEIAREYEKNYPYIFSAYRKENGGHGSVLNMGKRIAAGKYVKVVDADDWVNTGELEQLVDYLEQARADIVWTNYYWWNEKDHKTSMQKKIPFAGVKYGEMYAFPQISGRIFMKLHELSIRRECLGKSPEEIDEHCFYVDMEYILFCIPHIDTVVFLNLAVYMYRIGREGQSVQLKQMRKRTADHEQVLARLMAFYEKIRLELPEEKRIYIQKGIASMLASQYKIYLTGKREDREKMIMMDETVKNKYFEIYVQNENRAVDILRKSDFRLYKYFSLLVHRKYKEQGLEHEGQTENKTD